MSRIIVKNLPDKITKERLTQIFSEKGVVTDVQLKFTKDGKFRKFAFIGFQKPESAEAAKESLNKSFIDTSRIQIETCVELGDPSKPRAWSKYAPENSITKKRQLEKAHNESEKENKKSKQAKKEKINDPKIKELLKSHEKDTLFTEFLEVNELGADLNINKEEEKEEHTSETQPEENEEEEEEEEFTLAKQDISDLEYLKLKTGKNLNLKTQSDVKGKDNKTKKSLELFTVKLAGLPLKVKKSQIKEFLNPLKPYTVRRALRMKGVAYCGFKTEKEMKIAVYKNKSFLCGKRIYVTAQKKKSSINSETEVKWKLEAERLKGLETVAESGRIFIRNLPYTTTEEDLRSKFEKYGPLSEFVLPIDSFTRKPKGFGIVTFLIPENACRAFNELDGTIFQGRMLHLLPALPNKQDLDEEEEEDGSAGGFKAKKIKKEKAKSGSSVNWNTFFIGENALAEAMAANYNTTKENVLDDRQSGAAVRLALGETQLINKMKEFLEENDVCLDSFEKMTTCPRSKTVILVKNLPFGTKSEEIREKFAQFGVLKRVVLPPSGVAALVEFIEPSEAKIAFRRIAYSKFKHVPMYLEWAPEKVFTKEAKSDIKTESSSKEIREEPSVEENNASSEVAEDNNNTVEEHIPVEGATIFVKNLNFATEEGALKQHFSTCGTVVSAIIARKKDPKQPGKKLSMGYGFVEFSTKESADNALKTLQFSTLDDHKIELKRSNRTLASESFNPRKVTNNSGKPSTKILVRNIPFQATQKEISDLFKVFGELKGIRLPKKMVGTGSHRGFCFVEYNTVQDAKRAFKAISQSTHLYGRRLVLEWASTDDNIDTLREKTAQQFRTGPTGQTEKKKPIEIEENADGGVEEEE